MTNNVFGGTLNPPQSIVWRWKDWWRPAVAWRVIGTTSPIDVNLRGPLSLLMGCCLLCVVAKQRAAASGATSECESCQSTWQW